MNLPPDLKVTSEMLWKSALIFFLIDLGLVPLLTLYVKPPLFRQLKWYLSATMAVFWFSIWIWVTVNFWDSVYQYVFPGWARQFIPFLMSLLFTTIGLLFWWLALRLPGNPVVNYCLLGGLWGMLTHLNAIRLGILEKPPLLQGAAPASAIVIAIFEFMFYWCITINLAFILHQVVQNLGRLMQKKLNLSKS